MKIQTKFNIKDSVKISDLNKIGKIIAIYICETGIQYSVRYFLEGSANTNYFYEDELSDNLEEKEKLGFKTEKV